MEKFYDTNALLALKENAFKSFFWISEVTLRELENIKSSRNKDDETKYNARKVSRLLDEHCGEYEVVLVDREDEEQYPTPDGQIIRCAMYVDAWSKNIRKYEYIPHGHEMDDDGVDFVTDDICCKNLARINGLHVSSVGTETEHIYKGYKKLIGTTEQINTSLSDENYVKSFLENEYILITNTDTGKETEMRMHDGQFVTLKLPSSKFIKGKNALQRCALDLLNSPEITSVALLGTYGSGKTYLAMRMGVYAVNEKGWQSKIVGVREIRGEGQEPGYLPGDLDDKVGNFFMPLEQSLEMGKYEFEDMKANGKLETAIPYFIKGCTYDSSYVIVDEAEDFTFKQIVLIGTRLGDESKIVFSGDYRQSLISKSENNALVEMCEKLKGSHKFGCIFLDTDVRSETSKMYADLLNNR